MSVREMTDEEKGLARHALGLPRREGRSYRNSFVTGPGPEGSPPGDYEVWMGMVADGLARRRDASTLPFDGDHQFSLTYAGAKAALKRGESLEPRHFRELSEAKEAASA